MTARKLTIHVIVPAAVSLSLVAAYFSGIDWLQQVVAPRANREFGLLENSQHALLIAIIVVTALGIKRKARTAEKVIMAGLLLATIFVLLEETDYGKHYYDLMIGRPWYADTGFRNVHNIGETTDIIKGLADAAMVLFFVVLPLGFARSRKPLLRYVSPTRFFILTMIVMVAVSKLAHFLHDSGFGMTGPIRKNISEFRELIIYYVFLIYLYELVFQRTYTRPQEGPQDERSRAGQPSR